MEQPTYHFTVGHLDCYAISDIDHLMIEDPINFLFAYAPEDEVELAFKDYDIDPNQIHNQFTALLVSDNDRLTLIDTGAGDHSRHTGKLLSNLQSLGFNADAISTVILSHGHYDHIGGLTQPDGSLTFPNAEVVMWHDEWNYWMYEMSVHDLPAHFSAAAQKHLPAVRERLRLVRNDSDIVPGIYPLLASGHTPGHIGLVVSSEHDELIYMADTVLHSIHIEHPEWAPGVDMLVNQAVRSRRNMLDYAASHQAMVMCYHFAFPGLGMVTPRADSWVWQPLESVEA